MSFSIRRSEFLYDTAPIASCHAATIVETQRGLVAAFFGGTKEGHADVCIYVCRKVDARWTAPMEVANGLQPDGSRHPCWNPVLFQPRGGPLMLFYKVGPNPSTWWGMLKTSEDDGQSWSDAMRLPEGILGPIKNKPVQLDDGQIISPSSIESKSLGWRVYFERSADGGKTWSATEMVEQDPSIKAIQPSVLIHSPTKLQAIGRTKSGRMFETWSNDAGQTWSKIALIDLPNCNSGTDAVTLHDGKHLLVYNDSAKEKIRVPLSVAISHDGRVWNKILDLEKELTYECGETMPGDPAQPRPDQYSYPSVIQAANNAVQIVYTWKRLKVRHVELGE